MMRCAARMKASSLVERVRVGRRSRCRRSGGTAVPRCAARRGTRRDRCAAARRPAGSSHGRTWIRAAARRLRRSGQLKGLGELGDQEIVGGRLRDRRSPSAYAIAESGRRDSVKQHLARPGGRSASASSSIRRAGEHVDQLDQRDRRPRTGARANGDGDLHGQLNGPSRGQAICPADAMACCMASAQLTARIPSSSSSQQVTASPLK